MAVPAPRIPVLLAILAFAARDAAAAPRSLDRARVHGLYQDGEFEKVLRELAAYGKGACTCTRDDSVFAEKHLAVVLAANPVTRELGRYHMHRLLDLAPRADLIDMYIGEEVDGVFEKVRKEHALRAAEPAAKPAVAGSVPTVPSAPIASAPAPSAPIPSGESGSAQPKAYSDAWARLPAALAPARSMAGVRPVPGQAVRPAPIAAAAYRGKVPSRSAVPARPRSAPVQAKAYLPWDQAAAISPSAVPPASTPAAALSRPRAVGAASMSAPASAATVSAASVPAADTSRPAWKEPGLWIGGGAAIAAIAFTLWHAGSEGDPGKAYAVPASLAK